MVCLLASVLMSYKFNLHPSYFQLTAFFNAMCRFTSYTASLIYIMLVLIRFKLVVQGVHQYPVILERVIVGTLVLLYIPGSTVLTGMLTHVNLAYIPTGLYPEYVDMMYEVSRIYDSVWKISYLVLDNLLGIILVITISKIRKSLSAAQSEISVQTHGSHTQIQMQLHNSLMKETLLYLSLWVVVTWFYLSCYIFNIPRWNIGREDLYHLQNLLGVYGEVFGTLQDGHLRPSPGFIEIINEKGVGVMGKDGGMRGEDGLFNREYTKRQLNGDDPIYLRVPVLLAAQTRSALRWGGDAAATKVLNEWGSKSGSK
ncbi:hypothetical protein HK102_008534 [Quaeritorhiza haematococci]|nr:hypothetical protein HK102_008534 [Quaeritorhiza haematococci]